MLVTPDRKQGLALVVMTPEVAGYPATAQHLCYAQDDIDSATEAVLAEIATYVIKMNFIIAQSSIDSPRTRAQWWQGRSHPARFAAKPPNCVTESRGRFRSLPCEADRSLFGVINHLKLRLILREPSPYAKLVNQDPSDNEYESDEDDFGLGVEDVADVVAAFSVALRKYATPPLSSCPPIAHLDFLLAETCAKFWLPATCAGSTASPSSTTSSS